MTSLAAINKTLQKQVELLVQQKEYVEDTANSMNAIKQKIADILSQQKSDRLKQEEEKIEARRSKRVKADTPMGLRAGLAQGTGLSWMSDFMSNFFGNLFGTGGGLIGKLTGVLGLAAGRLIKWGVIGTLIATYFSDEIVAAFETIEEWTGVDFQKILSESPLLSAALTFAAGAVVSAMTKGIFKLAGWSASFLAGKLKAPFAAASKAAAPKARGARPAAPTTNVPKPSFMERLGGGAGKVVNFGSKLLKKAPLIGTLLSAGFGIADDQYQAAGYGAVDRAALGIGQGILELGDLATFLGAEGINKIFDTDLQGTNLGGAFKQAVTSEGGSAFLQFRWGDVLDMLTRPTGQSESEFLQGLQGAEGFAPMTDYTYTPKVRQSVDEYLEGIQNAEGFAGFSTPTINTTPPSTGSLLTTASPPNVPVVINNITNNMTGGTSANGSPSVIMPQIETTDRHDGRYDRLNRPYP